MIYLLYISWLFIAQANDCWNGKFELNGNSECVFNCNREGAKFIDKTEVTFTQLLHSCGNVILGYAVGDCSTLDDVVWGVDRCECPWCKCATKDAAGSPVLWERLMDKRCLNCTCDAHYHDTAYTGYVYGCDETGFADSGYEWEDFECPAEYCKDNNDHEVFINDAWWGDVAEGAKCEKFCYCDAGAATVCVTGWSNILESDNEGLVDAFNRKCRQSRMADCLDEPDRLFNNNVGPSCDSDSCPKCDCGTHTAGEKWWTEYEEDDEPGQTQCIQCQCIDTGGAAPNYASCGYESIDYVKGKGECPPATSIKCHRGYGGSTDPTGTVVAVGTLSEETCYDIEVPSSWCTWNVENSVRKTDGSIDSDSWDVSWGGCDGFMCGIFGANDECFYADYSYSYKDCYGRTRLRTTTQYTYCCNSDNCNHKDIDISKCIEKPEYGEVMASAQQCSYDVQTKDDAHCSVDNYKEEKTTCPAVKNAYKEGYSCQCKMMSGMYNEASAAWKKVFDEQKKGFFSGVGYGWDGPLGDCPIDLQCNLGNGQISDDKADNKIYFVAAIFTAIVVMIIY